MTPRETVIEAMARAIWESESMRATGKPRRVDWSDASPQDQMRCRASATTALNALLATLPALGLKIVPIEADEAMAEAWAGASVDTASAGLPDNEVNMLHAQSDWSAMLAAAPDLLKGEK